MLGTLLRFFRNLTIALVVAGASTLLLAWTWGVVGGGAMSVHGWIALGLGLLGTVGLTWVLMSLAFRSHREGWDDRVDNTLDPGRDDD